MSERLNHALPLGEFERRWAAARAIMDDAQLDALVLQNSNDWLGGYVRWFTGKPACNAYPRALLFPREGGSVVVEQGPFGKMRAPVDDPFYPGVAKVLTTPSYVAAHFTDDYDARLIADEIKALGIRRIGWVAPGAAYHSFGKALEAMCPDAIFVDVTDAIDLVKAVKSPEELDRVRLAATIQDKVIEAVTGFIKPGLHDFEVAAFAQYEAQRLGSEQGICNGSSSPANKAAIFRPPYAQGRKIAHGDVFALLVETNGPAGYYCEIGRTFSLGRAGQAVKDALDIAVEAQRYTLDRLTPGTRAADVFAAHNAWMRARGLPEEARLYSHGQGYDMVERPLVRQDETMTIEAGMSIVVHPGYVTDEVNALICDNYIIGPEGPGKCLHSTAKTVIEL